MTVALRKFTYAASPLHWSRIWPSLSSNSPTVLQPLNGHPSLNAGHLAAIPFFFSGNLANGQTLSANTGHWCLRSSREREAGYYKGKIFFLLSHHPYGPERVLYNTILKLSAWETYALERKGPSYKGVRPRVVKFENILYSNWSYDKILRSGHIFGSRSWRMDLLVRCPFSMTWRQIIFSYFWWNIIPVRNFQR